MLSVDSFLSHLADAIEVDGAKVSLKVIGGTAGAKLQTLMSFAGAISTLLVELLELLGEALELAAYLAAQAPAMGAVKHGRDVEAVQAL